MSDIKNMNITLHLQTLHLPAPLSESEMPFKILWIRGKQTVDSKKRVLKIGVPNTSVNEKFQITTSIEYSRESGVPCQKKMVRTVLRFNE